MGAGRYDEACPKFAESERLDPAAGTLLNLAVCHEKQGKTATAWAEYNDVIGASRKDGNTERQRIALQRIQELEPRLCHLSIVSADPAMGHILSVKVDGVTLGKAALGAPIPINPGTHVLEVEALGAKPWSGTIKLAGDGASSVVTVLAGADHLEPSDKRGSARNDPRSMADDGRKRLAIVLGATGVAALGAGVYFGLRTKDEWDERNAHCASGCDATAVAASKSAQTLAIVTDTAFGVALVGIGLATYFALTSGTPRSSSSAPVRVRVGADGGYVTLGGSF